MGNLMGARLRLDQLREDPWTEAMDEGYEKSERKWRPFWESGGTGFCMGDWVEQERLGRDMLAMEAEIAAFAGSNDREEKDRTRQVRLAIANTYLGEALFSRIVTKKRPNAWNQPSPISKPPESSLPTPVSGIWVMSPAAVYLAKAFQKTGNPSKALATLEWAFNLAEGLISENRGNLPYLWSADTAWQLAQALDPDDPEQASRRTEALKLGRERLNQCSPIRLSPFRGCWKYRTNTIRSERPKTPGA